MDANDGPVGVVGLGSMGVGMARALMARGFAVVGFDAAPARLALAAENGVAPAADAAAVFAAADRVVLSLPLAEHVRAVVEAGLPAIRAGRSVVIDTSTSEPEVSRALGVRLGRAGHGFLDAPVSGGPGGAASGRLTMMVGGAEADLALARPVVDAMAATVLHVGPSGAGNVAKLVNNLLVAAHMLTTREALTLAAACGVAPEAALRVINAATGRSAVSEVHVPTWITSGRFDSGFSAGLMRKDVRLARAMAERAGVALPVTGTAGRLWAESAGRVPDADDFTRMGAVEVPPGDAGG